MSPLHLCQMLNIAVLFAQCKAHSCLCLCAPKHGTE